MSTNSYVTGAGNDDPNSAIGDAGAAILLPFIQDTRAKLQSLNLPKTLPVGTADAGSFFNNKILANVDYGVRFFFSAICTISMILTLLLTKMSNVHPWFANVSAANAAGWVADFFQITNVDVANTLSNKPTMFIAETGWPTVIPIYAS
jgi:exo-beta-1,3-glucanase (GH17 family)